jgi:hypothetical protein
MAEAFTLLEIEIETDTVEGRQALVAPRPED